MKLRRFLAALALGAPLVFAACGGTEVGVAAPARRAGALSPLADDRALTPDTWYAERSRIRNRLRPLLGVRPAVVPDPNVEIVDQTDYPGGTRYTIELDVEVDERIDAYVLVPYGARAAPGIIAFHQTVVEGKDEVVGLTHAPDSSYGLELAEAGYVVIAIDDFTAGTRIPPGYGAYDTAPFYARHPDWSALDKSVWDGERALDALCTFEEVDCHRLGAVGHSQGGVYAWMLAADDPRIKAAVSNCGYGTFQGDPEPDRWARAAGWVGMARLRPYLLAGERPFEFHEWLSLAAPRDVLILGASQDHIFPWWQAIPASVDELGPVYRALWNAEGIQFVVRGGEHGFPAPMHQVMKSFLASRLHPD
jgi:dienelactone hydrolase